MKSGFISIILAILSMILLTPLTVIIAIIAFVLAVNSIRKQFSFPALFGIIFSIIALLLSAYIILLLVTDPTSMEVGDEIEALSIVIDGTMLVSILSVVITIVLYIISINPRLIRPGYGSLVFAMLSAFVSLISPYLAIFMVINSLIFASFEFYFIFQDAKRKAGYIELKKTTKDVIVELYSGFAFLAVSIALFTSGFWLIFSIREIMGLNGRIVDPVTGSESINANWVIIYLAAWAVLGIIAFSYEPIKKSGFVSTLQSILKYIAIGDWTYLIAYGSRHHFELRWLRQYKIPRLILNILFRASVIFIIYLIATD